ncbi:MAG: peptide chain release factor N(5)-glutamine methyltransferase [Anaerolineae bacterium]|nr:peptide chain release factor N(5)-glutamine methyltransferase [Anaerolineae bacterium]
MPRVSKVLTKVVTRLTPLSDSPKLDAQVLLAEILGKSRSWLTAHPDTPLTKSQIATTQEALSRLEAGQALPHVLGHWEFFGLDFDLDSNVLIPRPETELLVERAIHWLHSGAEILNIADVGTGSGCIAVAIAKNVPEASIIATDISWPALAIADRNGRKHNVADQIDFVQCDLLSPFTKISFNLICANLPYIPTQTLLGLDVYKSEPTLALDGGREGLELIRRLLSSATELLTPKGMLLFEIEASLGDSSLSLAKSIFDSAKVQLHQDLSGRDRLVEIKT